MTERSKIGSAILGMFAAIKICRAEGYEPADVLRLVERQTEEWGLLPEKDSGKEQNLPEKADDKEQNTNG